MFSDKKIIYGALSCINQEELKEVNSMDYVLDHKKAFFQFLFPKIKFDKESKKFKKFLQKLSALSELGYIEINDGDYLQDCFYATEKGLLYLQSKNKSFKEKVWNFAFAALGAAVGAFLTWLFKS